MKNEDFLDLLNEIDEKYIESANKRLEELHQYKDPEFGKALKPQVIRLETPEKRHIPFRTGAFAAVAAALVCAVTAGVFVKLNKPPTFSPSSGVTLSEASHISEPSIPEQISSEPVSSDSTSYELTPSEPERSEPTSSEPTSREPTSSEPALAEPKIKRLEQDGYDFSLEILDDGGKVGGQAGTFMKIDSEEELAICFSCSPERKGQSYTIDFFSYDGRTRTVGEQIAVLTFTAKSDTQWFRVPYKKEFEEGDECIVFIRPVSRYNKSHVTIRGKILP